MEGVFTVQEEQLITEPGLVSAARGSRGLGFLRDVCNVREEGCSALPASYLETAEGGRGLRPATPDICSDTHTHSFLCGGEGSVFIQLFLQIRRPPQSIICFNLTEKVTLK